MSSEKRAKFMQGRMMESVRVAKMSNSRKSVYPYTWIKYYDTKQFVDKVKKNFIYLMRFVNHNSLRYNELGLVF